jgi:ribosomal protein S18 acetylase RimI-like enzyme
MDGMSEQITLRQLTPADQADCARLLRQVFNQPPWNDNWTAERAAAYVRDFFSAPRFRGFAALDGTQLIGICLGHVKLWWQADEYCIDEFCVHTARQRRGVGGQLLGYARRQLAAEGVACCTLLTASGAPAEAFYRGQGFRRVDEMIFMVCEDQPKERD